MPYRAVITSHNNPNLSGVAKFNAILAEHFGSERLALTDMKKVTAGPVLLSLKLSDCPPAEVAEMEAQLKRFRDQKIEYDVFFHTFVPTAAERALVESCRKVFVGNNEIEDQVKTLGRTSILSFCPALLDTDQSIEEGRINVFSFGMAHKIQAKRYSDLHRFLSEHGSDFYLWVSTAFHERSNFGDFNSISQQLGEIYKDRIRFLGFLSDEAVNYFLDRSHLFVAFFEKGMRANNTSVYGAMNRGCAVLTNLDKYSPGWLEHGKNVLDIAKLKPADLSPTLLKEIGAKAKRDSLAHASWPELIQQFKSTR